jgi:archaemetzincin
VSIVVLPLGKIEREILAVLQEGISKALRRLVLIGKALPDPDFALDQRRKQYLATALIGLLQEHTEYLDHERVFGVVNQDLYVPELNFVFGLASGMVAVIGLTRLRQEFYGLPADRSLFEKRALTEAVHELGHTYNLMHCANPGCVMFFSNTLADTDRKSAEFCIQCRRKLR